MSPGLQHTLFFAGGAVTGTILFGLLVAFGRSEEDKRIYERGVKEGIRRTWALIRKFKGITEVRSNKTIKD